MPYCDLLFQKCFELCKESSESQLSNLRNACCGNVKVNNFNISKILIDINFPTHTMTLNVFVQNDKDDDLVKATTKKSKEMWREMAPWTVNGSSIYHVSICIVHGLLVTHHTLIFIHKKFLHPIRIILKVLKRQFFLWCNIIYRKSFDIKSYIFKYQKRQFFLWCNCIFNLGTLEKNRGKFR